MKKKLLLLLSFFFLQCRLADDSANTYQIPSYQLLNNYEGTTLRFMKQHLIDLLVSVALGAEYGDNLKLLKKWTTPMRIYVTGTPNSSLEEELFNIINEINVLCTDGFYIEQVATAEAANMIVFFGTAEAFGLQYAVSHELLKENLGLVVIRNNGQYEIISGTIFVDMERSTPKDQMHVLREELTQSLGLLNDLLYYRNSIFYTHYSTTTSFSDNDRELIRLLYHPAFYPGMSAAQIQQTGKQIMGL